MAAKHQPKPGGKTNALTRKLGPLPVWAWAIVVAGVYLLYRNYKSGTAGATGAATANPVPGSDQSGSGLGTGGGIGASTAPTVIYNIGGPPTDQSGSSTAGSTTGNPGTTTPSSVPVTPDSSATTAAAAYSGSYGAGSPTAPPPSSVSTSSAAVSGVHSGVTSTRPGGRITHGGGITGRGVTGGR